MIEEAVQAVMGRMERDEVEPVSVQIVNDIHPVDQETRVALVYRAKDEDVFKRYKVYLDFPELVWIEVGDDQWDLTGLYTFELTQLAKDLQTAQEYYETLVNTLDEALRLRIT